MGYKIRTHTCGELREKDAGTIVTLNGWVNKKRDLGGILFIDIRDRYGITQIRVKPDSPVYPIAEKLGLEYVISVSGKVVIRENKNKNLPTGDIEIDVNNLQILNESKITPFVVEDDIKASEELRLQYRYLDLRRKPMTENLLVRNQVYQIVHNFYNSRNFIEVETPILMKSTPEGARDYLVPSRIHKGKFYALPQSPQTYKQLLMVAGLDKYVQICKCFRDEDLRSDRQPEFTQIDVEMSFVNQEMIFSISEELFQKIWKEVLNVDLKIPFDRITYDEAIATYGIDKPDFRLKDVMKIIDLSHLLAANQSTFFNLKEKKNCVVAGFKVNRVINNKDISITRKIIDSFSDFAKSKGYSGLGYLKLNEKGELQSPLLKFLSEREIEGLSKQINMEEGETFFLLVGEKLKTYQILGELRLNIAEHFSLLSDKEYRFVWVTDFPLFKYNEEEKKFEGEHHIFTMPKDDHLHLLDSKDRESIESIRANCYDLVLNGSEIGSGSLRIYNSEIQQKVFNIVGLSEEESREKFGFMLEAFKYGAPPHGGIAFGYDRIIAILRGLKSIRDVIAFPKTVSAVSLMDNCPSYVTKQQLDELHLQIKNSNNN
ncbi:MAG: aspartate--tRNA ligase [Ignavibacteria bacterium]